MEDDKQARSFPVLMGQLRGNATALMQVLSDKAYRPSLRYVVVEHNEGNFTAVAYLEEPGCFIVKDRCRKHAVGVGRKNPFRMRTKRRSIVQIEEVRLYTHPI